MDNSILRSDEELAFVMWLDEAIAKGIIIRYKYEPESFEVLPKATYTIPPIGMAKVKKKHLLANLSYTPDFYIYSEAELPYLKLPVIAKDGLFKYLIDVKGVFAKNGGHALFSVKQKIIYNKLGLYVNKVIPCKFFASSFVPMPITLKDDVIWTNAPKRRLRSAYAKYQK